MWCKSGVRVVNVPSNPHATYKHDGWQGYGHWLGTGNLVGGKHQQFLPFKKALLHARSLKLKTLNEWEMWCKSGVREGNVPSAPHRTYKHEGWQGYGHWLGTGTVSSRTTAAAFLPFDKALAFARALQLKNKAEWRVWCKSDVRPRCIPSNPNATYQESWQGWA